MYKLFVWSNKLSRYCPLNGLISLYIRLCLLRLGYCPIGCLKLKFITIPMFNVHNAVEL